MVNCEAQTNVSDDFYFGQKRSYFGQNLILAISLSKIRQKSAGRIKTKSVRRKADLGKAETGGNLVRFDELIPFRIIAGMGDEDVFAIQRFYPQVYLACHGDHVRAGSTRWRLSSHDSAILSHLDADRGVSPRELQRHLGVAASSVSASLKRLAGLGYLTNEPSTADRRRREIRLTATGLEALADTSVLDTAKLTLLLSYLSPDDRRTAVRGLELLAGAARRLEGPVA